jgi:hypothetical protein
MARKKTCKTKAIFLFLFAVSSLTIDLLMAPELIEAADLSSARGY